MMCCSRCKKDFERVYNIKSESVCIKCLTEIEINELVKKLNTFWLTKS